VLKQVVHIVTTELRRLIKKCNRINTTQTATRFNSYCFLELIHRVLSYLCNSAGPGGAAYAERVREPMSQINKSTRTA
jgi:hypothetical protein